MGGERERGELASALSPAAADAADFMQTRISFFFFFFFSKVGEQINSDLLLFPASRARTSLLRHCMTAVQHLSSVDSSDSSIVSIRALDGLHLNRFINISI